MSLVQVVAIVGLREETVTAKANGATGTAREKVYAIMAMYNHEAAEPATLELKKKYATHYANGRDHGGPAQVLHHVYQMIKDAMAMIMRYAQADASGEQVELIMMAMVLMLNAETIATMFLEFPIHQVKSALMQRIMTAIT